MCGLPAKYVFGEYRQGFLKYVRGHETNWDHMKSSVTDDCVHKGSDSKPMGKDSDEFEMQAGIQKREKA